MQEFRPRYVANFSRILCLSLFALPLLIGCYGSDRPPLGYVQGKVTIDGQPLSGVIVSFAPEEGRPGVGVTDADGNYEIKYTADVKGTKVGSSKITFMSQTGTPSSHPIPAKYQSGSEFVRDVKKGKNNFDFELVSDEKKSKPAPKSKLIVD